MSSALLGFFIALTLVALLLAVPVKVAFRIDRVNEVAGSLSVRWLFGLAQIHIPVPTRARPGRQRKLPDTTSETEPPANARGVIALLRQPEFRKRVFRFLIDVSHAARVRDLHLRLRIGLGDPADTGRLWAFVGPLAGMASNLRCADVHIEPEFTDAVLHVTSHGTLRLVPLRFIVLAMAFAVSPPVWRAWRGLRQSSA